MSFRWETYLDLAHAIAPDAHPVRPSAVAQELESVSDEARYRGAVSRAYYAALSVCREYVRVQAPSFSLAGDAREHGDVRRWFLDSSDGDEKKMGRHLKILAEWRRQADYETILTNFNWKQTACGALKLAEEVCQRIEQP